MTAARRHGVLRLPRPLPGTEQDAELIDLCVMEQRAVLADALSVCESPMEITFGYALLAAGDASGAFVRVVHDEPNGPIARGRAGALFAQFPLDLPTTSIRIDFALFDQDRKPIAIEIDGYDHHHRTREQIASDNERDRALAAMGWRSLRFSGTEVHRDALKCAEEVYRVVGLVAGVAAPLPFAKAASTVIRPAETDLRAALRDAEQRGDVQEQDRLLALISERAKARLAPASRAV